VIFDWDGTVVDSTPVDIENFQAFSMKYFGVDANAAKKVFLDNLGEPSREIFLRLAALSGRETSEGEISEIAQKTSESFYEKQRYAPVFPDVPEALSELKDEGYILCVSSAGLQAAVVRDAKTKGLDHYFTFILGTRDGGFRKGEPHFDFVSKELCIKPRDMVFVGDGPHDMKVGKDYGCFTVGRIDAVDAETCYLQAPM